jgi:glycosyltransferase involved in cell wall biosynthesis
MRSQLLGVHLFPDFAEEGWPSMDLCAEMLERELSASGTLAHRFVPEFKKYISDRLTGRAERLAFNAERYWNRFFHYPRGVRKYIRWNDEGSLSPVKHPAVCHIVDHSYAHLVHVLPSNRTGIYCHDLDAFRSILEPAIERRPWWYRRMARHQLSGLRKAAIVFHSTMLVRSEIQRFQLVDDHRLVHAPYGVSDEFHAVGRIAESNLEKCLDHPFLLHVGSSIPRKRVDVLLESFAMARKAIPHLRLAKVGGGEWSPEHWAIIQRENLIGSIDQFDGISRKELAELYRRANLVLVTSEAEGFGLPVIEALASGAPVLCSDIPVLREVGGDAASYAPMGDFRGWGSQLVGILNGNTPVPDRAQRIGWASQYTWSNHARIIRESYVKLTESIGSH